MIRSVGLLVILAVASFGGGGSSALSLVAQHAAMLLLAIAVAATPAAARIPARIALPFAVFLAAAFAGGVLAPYGYAAWLVLLELGAFAFVAWTAASVGPSFLPRAATLLAALAAVQAVWAIVERVGGTLRPSGAFVNPNHLAAWLIAVGLLAGPFLWSRGRGGRLAGAGLLAVTLAALVVIGSRAAILGILAAGAAIVLFDRSPGAAARRRIAIASFALLVLGSVAGVALRLQVRDPYGLSRLSIWRASLGAVADDPVWGTGPGQFEIAAANLNFPLENAPLRYERGFRTPHSDLLRAPCEFGIPATAALLVAGALAFAALRRRAGAGLSGEALGAIAALTSLVAQGAVNDLTETPAIYLLGAVLLGCVLSEPAPVPAVRRSTLAAAACVAVAVGAFVALDVAPFRAWTIQRTLPRGALTEPQRADLVRALALNPWHPDLRLRLVADLLARAPSWTPDDYAAARESAETAVRLSPESSASWSALAHVEGSGCVHLFADVGSRERAEEAFRRAADRARHDPFIPLDAARFLLVAGDPRGARRHAERALTIEPRAVAPRLVLAEAIEALGGEGALERARELRAEARSLAERFASTPKESPYAWGLLTLDAPAGGD